MKKIGLMLAAILLIALSCISLSQAAFAKTYSLEEDSQSLPASYKSPYISPIKDQGYHGTCWIFSSISTLESNLKAMGYLNPEDENGYFDFSEQAASLDLTIMCSECGGACEYKHDSLSFVCPQCQGAGYGCNTTINDPSLEGGYEEMVFGYLCSGRGALKESQVPYIDTLNAVAPENFQSMKSDFQITDIAAIVPTAENIKRGIMSYGAMTMDCTMDAQKTSIVQNSDGRYSYAVASTKLLPEMVCHSMSVVGFDDNFSKSNFSIDRAALTQILDELERDTPPELAYYLNLWDIESLSELKAMSDEDFNALFLPKNDGAWLLKNSWGEGTNSFKGEGSYDFSGFVWVSYEDATVYNIMPETRAYAVTRIRTNDTSTRYQLDECGAVYHLPVIEDIPPDYAVANVFDFTETSKLNYITFETKYGKGCEYELYITALKDNGEIDTDFSRMHMLNSGSIPHDGYVTIDFEEDVILPKGKAAVVLKFCSDTDFVRVGLDTTFFDWVRYGNQVVLHYFPKISGNSFIVANDKLYTPLEVFGREADCCLKAAVSPTQQEANVAFGYADYSQAHQLLVTLTTFRIDKKLYTKDSWQRYQDALNNLQALTANRTLSYSSQQDIDSAVAELRNAIDDLENKRTWDAILAALAIMAALITIALVLVISLPAIKKKSNQNKN